MRGVADFIPKLYAVVVGLALLAILGSLAAKRLSEAYKARATSNTINGLATLCHEFANRFGRYATSQDELERWSGKRFPQSGWNTKIEYRQKNGTNAGFWIDTLTPPPASLFYEYDSAQPDRGVFTFPF